MKGEMVVLRGAQGDRLVMDCYGSPDDQPLLFLHGGGQTRHAWRGASRKLAQAGFYSLCADQRGHGDSDWVKSGDYDYADFGEDVVALCLQIKRNTGRTPVVIGASLGGIAAMLAVGELRPGCAGGVVLVDITPRVDQGGVSKVVNFMAEKMHEGFSSVEEAAASVAVYLPDRPPPKNLDGLRKNLRRRPDGRYRWHWDPQFIESRKAPPDLNYDDERVAPATALSDSKNAEARLLDAARRLDVPVLLVRGARSELVDRKHVEEFLNLAPHAEFIDVEGAGHMVAGDRNDIFADALIDFLSRTSFRS